MQSAINSKVKPFFFRKPFSIKVILNSVISLARPTQEWNKHKRTMINTDLNVLEFFS